MWPCKCGPCILLARQLIQSFTLLLCPNECLSIYVLQRAHMLQSIHQRLIRVFCNTSLHLWVRNMARARGEEVVNSTVKNRQLETQQLKKIEVNPDCLTLCVLREKL